MMAFKNARFSSCISISFCFVREINRMKSPVVAKESHKLCKNAHSVKVFYSLNLIVYVTNGRRNL